MKIQRSKNAKRNIIFGTINRLTSLIFPFIIRTVMIYYMGVEYVGLGGLFSSILSFLSLAELGIGTALVYSMYKPIATDDTDSICALLRLYRKLYFIIGCIIFTVGLALVPFLRFIVSQDVPDDVNIYILYFIYLLNTVISYWFFGYKQSILSAYQREDIISKRTMLLSMLTYTIQIICICVFKSYYYYIIWILVLTVLTNIANHLIVNHLYPEYKCRGTVNKETEKSIKKRVIALFGTKANSVVMHAADNIVISAFLGLLMVGKYGNYYYIINAIIGFMTVIYTSLTAGIGNSLETESIEKNYFDFRILSFFNAWIVTFFSASLLCLYQPFMRIWVGSELMLDNGIVILLVIYFYVYQIRRIVLTYKDAKGIWWEDKFRPYVMMLVNIVGNVVMVQHIGLFGVVLSTIISMIISLPWENYTVFRYIFRKSSKEYYFDLSIYVSEAILCCFITWIISNSISVENHLVEIIIRAVICYIIPNVLFFLLNIRNTLLRPALRLLRNIVKV